VRLQEIPSGSASTGRFQIDQSVVPVTETAVLTELLRKAAAKRTRSGDRHQCRRPKRLTNPSSPSSEAARNAGWYA